MKSLNCFYWIVKLLPVFDVVTKLSVFESWSLRVVGAEEASDGQTLCTRNDCARLLELLRMVLPWGSEGEIFVCLAALPRIHWIRKLEYVEPSKGG